MKEKTKDKLINIIIVIVTFIIGYYVGAIIAAERAQKEREKEPSLPTYEEFMSWEEENSRDTMSIIEDSIASKK